MWDGHGDFCSGDGASEPQDDSEGVERNKGEPGTNAIALLNPFLVLGFRGDMGGRVWVMEVEFGPWRWSLGAWEAEFGGVGGGVWVIEVEFGPWRWSLGRGRRSLGPAPERWGSAPKAA